MAIVLFCIVVLLMGYLVSDYLKEERVKKQKEEDLLAQKRAKKIAEERIKSEEIRKKLELYVLRNKSNNSVDSYKPSRVYEIKVVDTFPKDKLKTSGAKGLYELVLKKNWLEEPFFTTYFNLLQLLDKKVLIINPKNSNTITMDLRDEKNNVQRSFAFAAYETLEVVEYVVSDLINSFSNKSIQEIQSSILATMVFILKKSQYCKHKIDITSMIDKLLSNHNNSRNILELSCDIEQSDEYGFVRSSYERSLSNLNTYPKEWRENNGTTIVEIPKTPKKISQSI